VLRASAVASLLLFASGANPQSATVPAFEIASVKFSDRQAGSWFRFLPGGRLSATSWIEQAIQVAWGVEDYQVSGGPGWLGSDWYDIEAKAALTDATKEDMTLMLRSLLTDRFKLRVHQETKEFPAWNLVVDKNGPILVPLKDGEKSGCTRTNSNSCGTRTTAQLANNLHYTLGAPVFDKTGIEGNFDILVLFDVFSIRGQTPPPGYEQPSLYTALPQQLGLRLEQQKTSIPVIVVDSIQRPSEN
jgi:bla regulator protein BlaR1